MSAKSGQVLTWHEECLKCSVCLLSVSLDNVVFKEKLFCKSCYIENNLNKCDKCTKVGSVRMQSGNTLYICVVFRSSLARVSPSEQNSGTTPASAVTAAPSSSTTANSESSERKNSVIIVLKRLQTFYSNSNHILYIYRHIHSYSYFKLYMYRTAVLAMLTIVPSQGTLHSSTAFTNNYNLTYYSIFRTKMLLCIYSILLLNKCSNKI